MKKPDNRYTPYIRRVIDCPVGGGHAWTIPVECALRAVEARQTANVP